MIGPSMLKNGATTVKGCLDVFTFTLHRHRLVKGKSKSSSIAPRTAPHSIDRWLYSSVESSLFSTFAWDISRLKKYWKDG